MRGQLIQNKVLCLSLLWPLLFLFGIDIPLDIHGYGIVGRYLNSDTSCYYIDATTDLYGTLLKSTPFLFYIRYRDDLDVSGKPEGGVIFDPQRVHYYIVGGIDYLSSRLLIGGYYMHDCVHQIDYKIEGTPIFNRLKFSLAAVDFHYSRWLKTEKKFLWRLTLGWYPNWQYSGWNINYGADYKADIALETKYNILKKNPFTLDFSTMFHITKADSMYYHQHLGELSCYYLNNSARAIGTKLGYHIFNNDPIKNPNKLWLLSIFVAF